MFKFSSITTLIVGFAMQSLAINPLLVHSNDPIPFDKVDSKMVQEAAASIIQSTDAKIKAISSIPSGKQTIANTLLAMDEIEYDLSDLQSKLGVINATYENDSTRNTANEENEKLSEYISNILLNEKLYNSLKELSASAEARKMTAQQLKLMNDLLVSFEKNGMKISAEGRKNLEFINKKIIEFASAFDRNIAESKDSVEFTAEDLKGVLKEDMEPWKRSNGKYMVYVNGPNSIKISQYADNWKTRQTMYMHYNNRAYPKNISVLDSLLYYRQKMADQLGFKSYAEYALVDKMAKNPTTVWAFENDLKAKLSPLVTHDLYELKAVKKKIFPAEPDTIYAWDVSYFLKQLLDTKYQLNTDTVKQYFEMNNTVQGMFAVYKKLLNIDVKETTGVPTWYKKVKSYEMLKDGVKIGTFYFDLYPRMNKYTHFACFPISGYSKINGKEVLPVSALICNFPEGTSSTPSLLNHSDVITLFHEFGHLVHSMLGRSELASLGPFNVKGDFVEAPSQFLENWCWEYESLKIFAKNYKTGAPLPLELFQKMKKAQLVNSGVYYERQVYLGLIDFTFEDKYAETQKMSPLETSKKLFAMNQIPFPDGSHFICSFTHLSGYAANYYGYLWSRVFAQDMFSVFQKNGVMDSATGLRYRKEILESAATNEEADKLKAFLGREPNSDAFLKSIGVEKAAK
jgi:thimet oligopeptidase